MAKCLVSAPIVYSPYPQGYRHRTKLIPSKVGANDLQKSRKYFQMRFLCISFHMVGYTVQKSMASITILFSPLEEEGCAGCQSRAQAQSRYSPVPIRILGVRDSTENSCITVHLKNASHFFLSLLDNLLL